MFDSRVGDGGLHLSLSPFSSFPDSLACLSTLVKEMMDFWEKP